MTNSPVFSASFIFVLMYLYLCFLTVYTSSIIINQDFYNLISTDEFLYPNVDLSAKSFPVYFRKKDGSRMIYTSEETPQKSLFVSPIPKEGAEKIIIIKKGTDGLDASETNTFIVLFQTLNFTDKYTAHKAYLRKIYGAISVEWDVYDFHNKLDYKSFLTAISPREYYRKILGTKKLSNKPKKKLQQELEHRLQTIKESVYDASCFLAIFIPDWCKLHDPPASAELNKNEMESDQKGSLERSQKRLKSKVFNSKHGIEEEIYSKELKHYDKNSKKQFSEVSNHNESDAAHNSEIMDLLELKKTSLNSTQQNHTVGSSSEESESQESGEGEYSQDTSRKNTLSKTGFKKFACPAKSGAILKTNRCYCPVKTVLHNKVCVNKTLPVKETTKLMELPINKNSTKITTEKKQKKFMKAEASETEQRKSKREIYSKESSESFDADPVPTKQPQLPSLGPFYRDSLQINFNLTKIKGVLGTVPIKSLEFFKERYQVGNDKTNGHPQFESKHIPFTGIMDCKFQEAKLSQLKGRIEAKIVDYFLHSLRAQCHRQLRKNTLRLFKKKIVHVQKTLNYPIIVIDDDSKLLDQHLLTKHEWIDYISALYLAKYSETFMEQKLNMDKGLEMNISPDRKKISWTVLTLTSLVEKILDLLKQKKFQLHAVKITQALISTITEYIQKTYKQDFILNNFCKKCQVEHDTNAQDLKQLNALSEYVRNGLDDLLRYSIRFEQFYLNKLRDDL